MKPFVGTTFEGKIESIYYAIFTQDYSHTPEHTIGNLEFTAETKKIIVGIVALFSDYSDYTY